MTNSDNCKRRRLFSCSSDRNRLPERLTSQGSDLERLAIQKINLISSIQLLNYQIVPVHLEESLVSAADSKPALECAMGFLFVSMAAIELISI